MNKKRGYYTCKMGGKNRTLHFSFNFWANLTDDLGISLEDIGKIFEKGFNMAAFRSIIYCGVLTYHQENNLEVDFNVYNVGEWLDDFPADDIESILACMMETRILGNDLNMGIERNTTTKKKPKVAPKKSK